MAIALVQSNEGTSSTATTTASFSVAPTSGNLVVLCFASDDYNGTPDTGWTQSSEMEQQTFHGGYLWWRISNGSNSLQYTIGSATGSSWILMEFSGVDATPYDTSQGKFTATSGSSLISDSIVPSTGNRVLVAMLGASFGSSAAALTGSWDSSFTLGRDIGNNIGGTRDAVVTGYRLVTGNGSTGYTTTCTHAGTANSDARSSLVISFKEAAGGGVNVNVTTNLLTTSVGAATVEAKASVSPTTNLLATSVNSVTVQAKANVSPTTNLLSISVDQVTVNTGAGVGVNVDVTGQTLTVSVDTVTVTAIQNGSIGLPGGPKAIGPPRKIHRHFFLDEGEEEKKPPPPTKKRVRALQKEVLAEVEGLLGKKVPQKLNPPVRHEIERFWTTRADWDDLERGYERLLQHTIERIKREMDEDDIETLLLIM